MRGFGDRDNAAGLLPDGHIDDFQTVVVRSGIARGFAHRGPDSSDAQDRPSWSEPTAERAQRLS
jgi:hypothetical protein